jgi:hypothetical protein
MIDILFEAGVTVVVLSPHQLKNPGGRVRRGRGRWARRHGVGVVGPWVRFAFYGRMSTEEYQDRETSSRWQREVAEETIAGRQ